MNTNIHIIVRRMIVSMMIVLAFSSSIYIYNDYMKKKEDPCRYETFVTLGTRYSVLRELNARHIHQLEIMQANQELEDTRVEIALDHGLISPEQALATTRKHAEQILQLSDRQSAEYQALCKKLVLESNK